MNNSGLVIQAPADVEKFFGLQVFCTSDDTQEFELHIEIYSLSAYAEGGETHTFKKGDDATVKVVLETPDIPNITYSWIDADQKSLVNNNSDPSTFTINDIQQHTDISCIVSDEYGNSNTVPFFIDVEGTIQAFPEGSNSLHNKLINESNVGDTENLCAYVNTTLQSYKSIWYDENNQVLKQGGSEWSDYHYDVVNVQKNRRIRFRAVDPNNPDNYSEAIFIIRVTTFNATASTDEYAFGSRGDQATFGVSVSPSDHEVEYQWYEESARGSNDFKPIEGANTASYTFNMRKTTDIKCVVTDITEYSVTVVFYVDMDYEPVEEDFKDTTDINTGDSVPINVDEDNYARFFKFTPDRTSTYVLYPIYLQDTNMSALPVFELYDSGFQKSDQLDVSDVSDYFFTAKFDGEKDKTYYIRAFSENYSANSYSMALAEYVPLTIEDNITLSGEEFTYDGKPKTSLVTLSKDDRVFSEGSDYVLSYHQNVEPGIACVLLTGKKLYLDVNFSKAFTINKAPITEAEITGITAKTYNGKAQTQSPTVNFNEMALAAGTDYTLSYENNTNAGTATVTITGKGNYKGSIGKTFTIAKAARNLTVKAKASLIQVGKTTTVSVTGAKGTKSFKSSNTAVATVIGKGLVTGKKAGTVKITVTSAATTNYKAASKSVTIKVVPVKVTVSALQSIAKATVTCPATKVWTGWELTPSPTVKLGSKTLTHKTDYYQHFMNNTNVGIATITIIGTGDYTGTVKKTFKIIPKTTSISGLTAGRMQFTVKWNKQPSATTGCQISFSSHADFGTQKVVTVSNVNTTARTIKNLTGNHKYYVRVRTYKTVNGVRYHGNWSAVRTVTTK